MSSRSKSESANPSGPGSGNVSIASAESNSLYAGVARTAIRALALYFSRPVRLFRPSKASGWTTLRYAAQRDGASFSPQYIAQYVRQRGFSVLPRHFVPPLLINTALGTLLFTSYTSISSGLNAHSPNMSTTLVAAVSGAGAGAIQAIAGAPAENVRILMEQGAFHSHTSVSGWRHAWKQVFLLDPRNPSRPKSTVPVRMRLSDAREAQMFAMELREMAGRGWNGWGWGFSKDIFGYGLFFAIFDLSRRAAIHTSHAVELMISGKPWTIRSIKNHFNDFEHVNENGGSRAPTIARIAQGAVLVNGGVVAGVAYEYVGRPFDAVRREWNIYSVSHAHATSPAASPPPSPSSQVHGNNSRRRRVVPPLPMLVKDVYASGGLRAFFQSPVSISNAPTTGWQSRIYPVLRTLGRVGPWGVGFLVWEAFGPGIQ